jgi:hypothetical protein
MRFPAKEVRTIAKTLTLSGEAENRRILFAVAIEIDRIQTELAAFAKQFGDGNVVLAMTNMQSMKRENAELRQELERLKNNTLLVRGQSITTEQKGER